MDNKIRMLKLRNRHINSIPTVGFVGEEYERLDMLYKSDGSDEFLVLEPLYILYKGFKFDNYFKKIYKDSFGFKFPFIEISYKELNILFFLKLLNIDYYEDDTYSIIYILFKKGYIGLKQDNNNINFNDFSEGLLMYNKDIHIFNKSDIIYITNDGVIFTELLFNNNTDSIIKDRKYKYLDIKKEVQDKIEDRIEILEYKQKEKQEEKQKERQEKDIRIDFTNGIIFGVNNEVLFKLPPKGRCILTFLYEMRKELGVSINNLMIKTKQGSESATKKSIDRINASFSKHNIKSIYIDYRVVDRLYFLAGLYKI